MIPVQALQNLVSQMQQLENIVEQYELNDESSPLLHAKILSSNKMLQQKEAREFHITVLGTMKSGKSTFVNSLLGRT